MEGEEKTPHMRRLQVIQNYFTGIGVDDTKKSTYRPSNQITMKIEELYEHHQKIREYSTRKTGGFGGIRAKSPIKDMEEQQIRLKEEILEELIAESRDRGFKLSRGTADEIVEKELDACKERDPSRAHDLSSEEIRRI